MLRENPYAEWYLNSLQIKGSPTQLHHARVYGDDYPYDNFVKTFNDASAGANLDAMADACRSAGARYVVLTTKHHDGFALWPSGIAHPTKGRYHASRDLVGDLAEAVRARRMRMGLYYSGGYDWPYNNAVLRTAADAVLAVPYGRALRAVRHRARARADRPLRAVGVVERHRLAARRAAGRAVRVLLQRGRRRGRQRPLARVRPAQQGDATAWCVSRAHWCRRCGRSSPQKRKRLTFATPKHCDFRTPEYDVLQTVSERKWEMARGVGHSFGANRDERPEDIIGETELIQMFCDIVSKNGNLLIGIGPRPDGTIPDTQLAPLRRLGSWLAANGEAIYGSRPWVITESETAEGTPLRFTQSGEGVYALVMGMPSGAAPDAARHRRLAGPAGPPGGIARRPARVVERGRGARR